MLRLSSIWVLIATETAVFSGRDTLRLENYVVDPKVLFVVTFVKDSFSTLVSVLPLLFLKLVAYVPSFLLSFEAAVDFDPSSWLLNALISYFNWEFSLNNILIRFSFYAASSALYKFL